MTVSFESCRVAGFDLDFVALQRGAGVRSVRLGRRQHGSLHSAGAAAVEELHLPPETDCELEGCQSLIYKS